MPVRQRCEAARVVDSGVAQDASRSGEPGVAEGTVVNWFANAAKVITGAFLHDRSLGFTNRGVEDVNHDVLIAMAALKEAGLVPSKQTFLQDHRQVFAADGLPSVGPQLSPHRWCLESPGGCDCPRVRVSYSTGWLEWTGDR